MTHRQLGIYIHWPFCAAICPYCDFNVYKSRDRDNAPLIRAILADLAYWRGQTGPRQISSIFFGGGTPSLMLPRDVDALIKACDDLWGLAENVEIALEANPTDAEASRFGDLHRAGIERLSLGVQSLDDVSLKALGRFHSAEEAIKAAHLARGTFSRLSIDLIYARPSQSLNEWAIELDKALAIGADHISPYQLTIEKGTAFDRAVARGAMQMPDGELAADFFDLTQDKLEGAGYEAYEVSNHAKGDTNRSRHNLIYWKSQDWIGVGPGAHGRVGWRDGRRATIAAKRPEAYIKAVTAQGHGLVEDEILTPDAMRDEFWLMGLRMKDGVALADAPGEPLDLAQMVMLQKAGLAWQRDGKIGLTRQGRVVGDSVIGKLLGG